MPLVEPYGSGGLLVFDTSAWNRQRDPAVLPRWLATAESDLLAVCPVVALELLASARDEQKFADLHRTLTALPRPMSHAAPAQRPSVPRASCGASDASRQRTI
jgi:hypothetical protein